MLVQYVEIFLIKFEKYDLTYLSTLAMDHLILHLEPHCSSFTVRGAAILIEWLSPGHYLCLMLQTIMGYQIYSRYIMVPYTCPSGIRT